MIPPSELPSEFLQLSAQLGQDPLRVQGPGGNTSIKIGDVLWIKASGTELADAQTSAIFVPVHLPGAREEAMGAGDGTCMACRVDHAQSLRPSIETTFHALIDWPVVAHIHSVVTIAHGISPEGRTAARAKLDGLAVDFIPYRKPGRPLTERIAASIRATTQIWVLENHGLICAGPNSGSVAALIDEVERRLALEPQTLAVDEPMDATPAGQEWLPQSSGIASDERLCRLMLGGSYYPDHVVFLGPALPEWRDGLPAPASVIVDKGILVAASATSAQRAMAQCLVDVLQRLPSNWVPEALTAEQESELLNWDAEKYRQALAARRADA
jgi:rhamnose utilization protein RhaD (predicted bifunctional aldolase and dehydrogenase)